MRTKTNQFLVMVIVFFFHSAAYLSAQVLEKRVQYPWGLKNSYYGLSMGYITYPFSSVQLEPGFSVENIKIPHLAPRLILYGYQFNKNISVQLSYMRPVNWVIYNNISNDRKNHSVWMNIGGLTMASHFPITKKITLFTEAGLGLITRKGFQIRDAPALKNTVYASLLSGVALQYHIDNKWELLVNTTWSPSNKKEKQPRTVFYSAGFNYHLKKLSDEKAENNILKSNFDYKHFVQISYTTNEFGYGANDLFSEKVPIFWGGAVRVKGGYSLSYQRNIFHTSKMFSFNWGAGMGYWRTNQNREGFFTVSVYPVLRFTSFRSKAADLFFEYSVAGPTFISKTTIDNTITGKHFTFQDFMGIGIQAGKNKSWVTGFRIAHFSNGNLFPQNEGVKVPLTLHLAKAFN